MKIWSALFPIIMLILTAVVLLASCNPEVVEPVQNMPISYAYDEFGNVTGKWEYNSHGYVTKYTRYDESGNVTLTGEYEYNSDNYCTKYTEYYASGAKMHETIYDGTSWQRVLSDTGYDESGNVTSSFKNEYNPDGNITKYTEYYASGAKMHETIYDGTSHRVLSETSYYASGAKKSETIYDGTSWRRVLSVTNYDESGNVTSTHEYEYGSDGYLTKYTEYYASGAKKSETIYDGTSVRRVLSVTNYDESGNVISTRENEYNSDGNITKYTEYYMGTKKRETIYDGTSWRRMLSDTSYDESGNVKSTWEYAYNSDGYRTKSTLYYKNGDKSQEIIYDGTSKQRVLSDASYYAKYEISKKVYEYNSDGYLTKYTEYHMKAKTHEIIYDGTSEQRVLSDTTW